MRGRLTVGRKLLKLKIYVQDIASQHSLVGVDDPQLVEEIYNAISSVDMRIASGIEGDFKELNFTSIKIDEIALPLEYERISLLFFPNNYKEFMEVIETLEKDEHIFVADKKDFNEFVKMVQKVSKRHDIRNLSAIMVKIIKILKEVCHDKY